MKPKWLLITLFTLVLGTSETFSQEKTALELEGTLDLTLEDCVEIALKHNPEVVNARLNVDIQALALRTAKGWLLPSINSRYGLNKAITGPRPGQFLDPVTQQVITSPGRSTVSSSHSVGANISIPIYNANTLASIAADRAGLRGRKQDLRGSRVSTIHAVKKRFFEVLQAEKLLALNQESVRTAEESLRRSKTMYEIGSVAVSDVLKARSALEALKVTVITQDNEMKIARSNLAFVLGIDVNRSIRLKAGDLTVEPMALSYEQALTKAVDRRPDLQSKNFDLEQTRRQMDAARALIRRPTVSMSAGYSWRTQNTPFQGIEDLFLQNYSYTFGLNISLPIFNGMRTENQGDQNELRYLVNLEQLRQVKRQIALDVKQSLLNLERDRKKIAAQQEAVKAAEEDFRLAEERYNFGAGTILERLDAQERLFRSKNQHINAVYDYQKRLADLEAALGGIEE